MLLLSVEILENVCMHPPVLIIKFIVLMIDNQNRKVFFFLRMIYFAFILQ